MKRISYFHPGIALPYSEAAEAFSGTNPEHPEYSWKAEVTFLENGLRVAGHIYYRETRPIGEFMRSLYFEPGVTFARHVTFRIDRMHRRKRIAYYHYRKALRFYDSYRFQYVELLAQREGLLVWPQFAFDLAMLDDKQRFLGLLHNRGILTEVVEASELFLPAVAFAHFNGGWTGSDLIQEFHEDVGASLPLRLDLQDQRQRDLLLTLELLLGDTHGKDT